MKSYTIDLLQSEPFVFLKGALVFLIGPIDTQIAYLLLTITIDLVFGVQVAVMENKFRWSILFTKVRRKLFVYALFIIMFHAFDVIAGLPDTARWSVILTLAGMEILSAIRNTASLGHSKLADSLERVYLALVKQLPPEPPTTDAKQPEEVEAEELVIKGELNREEGGRSNEYEKRQK
jgi:phage-related holin